MNKNLIRRILFVILFLAVAFVLVYFAFKETIPELIPLLKNGDVDAIQDFILSSSHWKGILCTALLQILQVLSIVISGVPIQVAAGVVYGTFFALLICLLSSTFALMLSLLMWRRMGKRLAGLFPVGEKQLRLITKLTESGTPPKYTVFLAGMIPVVPNGLIPLIAAKLDISVKDFTIWVGLGSFPNILLCCAIGNRLIHGDWIISLIYFSVMMALVVVMWKRQDLILGLYRKFRQRRDPDPGNEEKK